MKSEYSSGAIRYGKTTMTIKEYIRLMAEGKRVIYITKENAHLFKEKPCTTE